MKTAFFISPHLDDAVFSCAEMIRHLVTDGWKVIVVTVFTEGADEHALRRLEDLDAAHLLGFEALHLGFVDAPFRQTGHVGFEEILFGWNTEDDAVVDAVTKKLRELINTLNPDRVFAPLGVGEHVDHRIVFQAARLDGSVEFYEERPYAYARGAVELRLRRLGVIGIDFDEERMLRDLRDLPFVRLYSSGGKLLPVPSLPDEALWADAKQMVADFRYACEAAKCYASQYMSFCGDEETHELLEKRHGLFVGGTEERWERTWILRKMETTS